MFCVAVEGWWALTLETGSADVVDQACDLLWSLGAAGVSYEDQRREAVQLSAEEQGAAATGCAPFATGYFSDAARTLALPRLDSEAPWRAHWERLQPSDWAEAWKAYFKPMHRGGVWILPAWQRPTGRHGGPKILIDPGEAFGTGQHATTELMLRLLAEVPLAGAYVADIGTGSGILGLAALRLGATRVDAYDTDPVAVAAALANARLNNLAEHIRVQAGPLSATGSQYDVVLSNIVADVLIETMPAVRERLKPGGHWLGSGVAASRWSGFRKCLLEHGFVLGARRRSGLWRAFDAMLQ